MHFKVVVVVVSWGMGRVADFSIADLRKALSPKLESIFFQNSALSGVAIATAGSFKTWFEKSGTPFFKEYTDHTFDHALDVFTTSCEIIAIEARDVLSSEDLNILFWACIIHDAGLHLGAQTSMAFLVCHSRPL